MLLQWTNHAPARDFRAFERQMDEMLRSFFPQLRTGSDRRSEPAFNVYEDGDGYRLEAELPGFTEADLEIRATSEGLTIKGQRKLDVPEGYRAVRRERTGLQFTRTFEFAVPLEVNETQASLENGVLTIRLRKQAKAQPRRIAVKTA